LSENAGRDALLLLCDNAVGLPVVLGGGRKEPKPLNRLPPVTLARLAGGSSFDGCDASVPAAVGKFTTILPGFDRSTSFWKGLVLGLEEAAGLAATLGCASVSESESESE
jgi:hypothetical protein